MEVRDPIHGSIHILKSEEPILEHPFFHRLRRIKQLGFSEYVFPGATHTRFLHSIGVMRVGSKVFEFLFREKALQRDFLRLKETLKLACLLHDVGHAPLSHACEMMMPSVADLKLPSPFTPKEDRQATHEDYTIKSIVDSSFTEAFDEVKKLFGIDLTAVAELILGKTRSPDYFTIGGINYFPLLHQLVSSELDCDRMDYLLRDSYFCGVSYGKFDLDWIVDNLEICIDGGEAFLGISERAVATFDDFLLSRYHMFLMVYFHYKPVCLEQLLYRYFKSSDKEYSIPASIEDYLDHDDNFLWKILRASKNPYAEKITLNKIPPKIYESFNDSQHKKIYEIKDYLDSQSLEYILCSSASRISKYYGQSGDHPNPFKMKVVRRLPNQKNSFLTNITEATDLFSKFSHVHKVNRLHLDLDCLDGKILKTIQDMIQQ